MDGSERMVGITVDFKLSVTIATGISSKNELHSLPKPQNLTFAGSWKFSHKLLLDNAYKEDGT